MIVRRQPPPRGQRGFTLLEVLVALVIAALGTASVMQAFGSGTRSMMESTQHLEALSRARSRLDATGAAPTEAEQSGDDGGGFHYRTLVRAIGSGASQAGAGPDGHTLAPVATLFAITVWISWGHGREPHALRLDTERLYAASPG